MYSKVGGVSNDSFTDPITPYENKADFLIHESRIHEYYKEIRQ